MILSFDLFLLHALIIKGNNSLEARSMAEIKLYFWYRGENK